MGRKINNFLLKAYAPIIQRSIDETGANMFAMLRECYLIDNGNWLLNCLSSASDYNIFWSDVNKQYKSILLNKVGDLNE